MDAKIAIIISASSDIGSAICEDWHKKNWQVLGTYRTLSSTVQKLMRQGIDLIPCDLLDSKSLENASIELQRKMSCWDTLLFASGLMEPIGLFSEVDFSKWENGLNVNLIKPLQIVHKLLPYRNKNQKPTVIFFAGGGTNNAVTHYSSYTLSKIALIKMCELLAAEIEDTRFVIVGPGWVKTKIHQETLKAKEKAGKNLQRTLERLKGFDWVSMDEVIQCCNYLATTSCNAISGRNFSLVYDSWGTAQLEKELEEDSHMYKLRRYKNS